RTRGHDTSPTPPSLFRKQASDTPLTQAAATIPEPKATAATRTTPRPAPKAHATPSHPAPTAAPTSAPAITTQAIEPPASTVSAPVINIDRSASAAQAAAEPASRPKKQRGNIWFWRLTSVVFALVALVLGLMPAQPVAPPVTVLQIAPTQAAILQAPGQSSTPGWVVTVDL